MDARAAARPSAEARGVLDFRFAGGCERGEDEEMKRR